MRARRAIAELEAAALGHCKASGARRGRKIPCGRRHHARAGKGSCQGSFVLEGKV